jgi:hypothetical protein
LIIDELKAAINADSINYEQLKEDSSVCFGCELEI